MPHREPAGPRGIAAVLLLALFLAFAPVQPAARTVASPTPIVVYVLPAGPQRRRRRVRRF
ncbi:MAG: hypothetical protein HY962_11155 [Ignavibacteriae bacterium]|nr:hypothetical protein [Ignavibacteriota bacterium]